MAIAQRPDNRAVLTKWIERWSALADDAAHGLGELLETLPEHGVSADQVAAHARSAREQHLAGLLDEAVQATAEVG
jgi:toluene monooxygenase system protein E